MVHVCVGNLTIVGPDNGLSPGRRQVIVWTNAGILLIGHKRQGTNLSEILIDIQTSSSMKGWVHPSGCPPFHLSVTSFSLCFHHCIIMKFSGVITNDKMMSMQKFPGQRSKVKVTEVKTQLSRFSTVTHIHVWWRNDAHSLIMLRRGALLFFKVIRQISRSHGTKKSPILARIERFRTVTQVLIYPWCWNDQVWRSIEEEPYCFPRSSIRFQGRTGQKAPILTRIERFRTVTPVWIHWWI